MAQLLQDKDRIFTNLYGLQDEGLEGAKTAWCMGWDICDAGAR